MARPRVPDEILEARGAYIKNPQRRRAPSPKNNNPLGNAPTSFCKEEKKCWAELGKMVPANVLTQEDRWTIELACVLMAKFRQKVPGLSGSELSSFVTILAKIGMTPADRSKIGANKTPETEANPFAQFN